MKRKETLYEKYIKRFLDICGVLLALIILGNKQCPKGVCCQTS